MVHLKGFASCDVVVTRCKFMMTFWLRASMKASMTAKKQPCLRSTSPELPTHNLRNTNHNLHSTKPELKRATKRAPAETERTHLRRSESSIGPQPVHWIPKHLFGSVPTVRAPQCEGLCWPFTFRTGGEANAQPPQPTPPWSF